MRKIIVGSRKSNLALTQTNWVIDQLKKAGVEHEFAVEKIVTKGDKILDVTLSKVGGKGLFVKEIEQAMYDKKIDFAVHSMKDMPAELPEGLIIAAIPKKRRPSGCAHFQGWDNLRRIAGRGGYRYEQFEKISPAAGEKTRFANEMDSGKY